MRQSFFHDEPRNFTDLGGGVSGCKGFHSSFRATQGGLSLNMGKLFSRKITTFSHLQNHYLIVVIFELADASTTMIVKPGPVVDFLLANQNARDPYQIDWSKVIYYSFSFPSLQQLHFNFCICSSIPGQEDAQESENQGQPLK